MTGGIEVSDLNSAALLRTGVHRSLTRLNGAGIAIVVIDYGFDLLHPAFRTARGETRFAALIDQNGGRLDRRDINQLLRRSDGLGDRDIVDRVYDPHAHYFGRDGVGVGAHGSWVASIAAGSCTGTFAGVAPNATLIGVQLDLADSAWLEEDAHRAPSWLATAQRGGDPLTRWAGWRSYEESRAIVAAIEEGVAAARALRPDGIVVNLSIGAWAGAHDIYSPVNRAIDAIGSGNADANGPMIVAVTGTGNAGADAGHVEGVMMAGQPVRFSWEFDAYGRSASKLEIWSDCADDMAVTLSSCRSGAPVNALLNDPRGGTVAISGADGQIVGIGENRGAVRGGLRCVRVIIDPSLVRRSAADTNPVALNVEVRSRSRTGGSVHAWLERTGCGMPTARLRVGNGEENTVRSANASLTPLAAASTVISVAGLDGNAADDTVLEMSGRGPRPWAGESSLPAPVLSAPAYRLFGARSKTSGYMCGSGTSGAAAIVSGAVALAMQAAATAGRTVDQKDLVKALLGRQAGTAFDAHWRADIGLGALRLDASSLIEPANDHDHPSSPRQEVMRHERTFSPANRRTERVAPAETG